MLYPTLKFTHILSAALLTLGIGVVSIQWLTMKNTLSLQKYSGFLIFPLLFFQFISGFTLVHLKVLNPSLFWIKGSMIGFTVFICAWLGFTYCALHTRLPLLASILLSFAIISFISIIFFMSNAS